MGHLFIRDGFMTPFQAILLGIVQGMTEFLPVSSTAHLLIAQSFMGIPATDAVFAFSVLVQLGTLLALFVFFWKDLYTIIRAMIQGLVDRKPFEDPNARLGWNVAIASIPAVIVGFFLRDVIEGLFKEPLMEAGIRLLITSGLLIIAELIARGAERARELEALNWKDALTVGLFQSLSIFPGASRSGSTISAGMCRNLSRPAAARFAFLISVPLMLVAGAYQTHAAIVMPGTRHLLPLLIVGFIAAAVVGWLALYWLVRYLKHNSLYLFASYTAVVGLICLGIYFVA
jgi:undecaprenyl-diphosphatase